MKITKLLSTLIATTALLAAPALADTSVAGGAFAPNGSLHATNAAAGIVTQTVKGIPFSSPQLTTQLSAALPIAGGNRYALTGELESRGPIGVGVGAGIGRLRSDGKIGLVYDFIAAAKVAPRTQLEARYYAGDTSQTGNAGFVGLRVSL